MDPALIPTAINIPQLLRQHKLSPRKSLGQNFLIDPAALEKVIDAADIEMADEVLEIGSGLGSLTRYLAMSAARVVSVEIDRRLFNILEDVLANVKNVHLVQGDILKISPPDLMEKDGYLVIANIPYYITSAIIRHLLEAEIKPRTMVLTIQKEVARRICAQPGDLSLLALSVQVFGKPTIAAHIPAGAFYPPPKVDSAVIRIDLYPLPLIPADQIETFFRLAKAGFGQKRKMLRRSLTTGLSLPFAQIEQLLQESMIDPTRRAETLSMDEWKLLTANYIQGTNN
ncbi:MAG: ribosomal RNA small subunit methyltransferase A [Chloroflexi bacterium 44-23]|nr:MAG: ribosomal RNA small subunit methyltransferase A [Chloroflexi bacterium 44-23]